MPDIAEQVVADRLQTQPGVEWVEAENKYIDPWAYGVVGCPRCKAELFSFDHTMRCTGCGCDYRVKDNIPSLIIPELRDALDRKTAPVKSYYQTERYDWTRDPRGLEFLYHLYRRLATWFQIRQILKPGHTVLDLGCGTGLVTSSMLKIATRVVAMDLNAWALGRVNDKLHVASIQGDGELLPIMDETIDTVVITEVLEHIEDSRATLKEIYRVCKKGAKIVGTVPSTHGLWKLRRQLSLTCAGSEPIHRSYTRQELSHLLQSAGFTSTIRRTCLGLNWLWISEKL